MCIRCGMINVAGKTPYPIAKFTLVLQHLWYIYKSFIVFPTITLITVICSCRNAYISTQVHICVQGIGRVYTPMHVEVLSTPYRSHHRLKVFYKNKTSFQVPLITLIIQISGILLIFPSVIPKVEAQGKSSSLAPSAPSKLKPQKIHS